MEEERKQPDFKKILDVPLEKIGSTHRIKGFVYDFLLSKTGNGEVQVCRVITDRGIIIDWSVTHTDFKNILSQFKFDILADDHIVHANSSFLHSFYIKEKSIGVYYRKCKLYLELIDRKSGEAYIILDSLNDLFKA